MSHTPPFIAIFFPHTKSKIVRQNESKLYACIYQGLAGIFRKDIESSFVFGRKVCDAVKEEMQNQGFFTSDELPHYGITQAENERLYVETQAKEGDLIVLFAYSYQESLATRQCLEKHLPN